VLALALGTIGPAALADPAAAAPRQISDAAFEWPISAVQQGAAQAGGCDYFVAGHSDGTLKNYTSQEGDVYVLKRLADGGLEQATSANRCLPQGPNSTNGQRLFFTAGQGTVADDGSATISWTGAGTINAYGGMIPW
jgi:hypothetical protein